MTDQLFASAVQPRATDERYTPREVFAALGLRFDLDPAAPAGGVPWVPATRCYSAADDGLAQRWHGLVWLNPPFSNPAPWARRWIDHANGVLLFPWNVNASWVDEVIDVVPLVRLLRHSAFIHPTHTGRHVPVVCALAGLGDGAAAVAGAVELGRALIPVRENAGT